jgi:hypothetical protein
LATAGIDPLSEVLHEGLFVTLLGGAADAWPIGVRAQHPVFKADSATRTFYGLKDGKITVNVSGWEQNRVVLAGAKPLR